MKLPAPLAALFRRRTKGAVTPWDIPRQWTTLIEARAGDWQRGIGARRESLLNFPAVFACQTLIASDFSKLGQRVVARERRTGIWLGAEHKVASAFLKRPNPYQNRVQFMESWAHSKLGSGNAYGLKQRDETGRVAFVYVLDPARVSPVIAPSGAVFYRLGKDNLAPGTDEPLAPASEIIHDRMNTLYHPLVGVSPLAAAALSATQGINIQTQSVTFFGNEARPAGLLTHEGDIDEEMARRLKTLWSQNYGGENRGAVAVLAGGLKYQPLAATSRDSQLVEQLKLSREDVCTAYHVPPYKVGVGPTPTYQNAAILNQIYYSDCLQKLIEDYEAAFDDGLELPDGVGLEVQVGDLLRMDALTQIDALSKATGAGIRTLNEARAELGLAPVEGGDVLFLQQQNWPAAALADRNRGTPEGSGAPVKALPAEQSAPDWEAGIAAFTRALEAA